MKGDGVSVLGLDHVRLELPIAGVGSRVLAATVDYLFLVSLIGTWWLLGLLLEGTFQIAGGWLIAVLSLGSFLLQWGYFATLEIVMQGRTPGKHALGLRVVSGTGGQASAMALVIRNLLRAIDILIAVPMLGAGARARRLGDIVADTLVVHDRVEDDALTIGRLPAGCTARQAVVLEAFFERVDHLEPERAQAMAGRLLDWLAQMEPEHEPMRGTDAVQTLRETLQVA